MDTDPPVTHDGTAPTGPAFMVDAAAWRDLLVDEDRRCASSGLGAGMVTVDFGVGVPRDSPRLIAVLDGQLGPTDRAAFVSASELQILLVPVATPNELERRAVAIDGALHAEGLPAGVGWATRRESGLVDASARADAGAAARRPRDGVIDIRDPR